MKIEQQVVSLELAKKLKELGVKQESLFARTLDTGQVIPFPSKMFDLKMVEEKWNWVSAFTVAELGELIGQKFLKPANNTLGGEYIFPIKEGIITADTEADARGKMLIYLLENKLISLT